MPAFNEEDRIEKTLNEYAEHLASTYGESAEIIIVLNGCTDRTGDVVKTISNIRSTVRVLEFPEPLGKGGAVWEGLALARGRMMMYVDADNMVRFPEAQLLVNALANSDIAIGDRFTVQQKHKSQPIIRRIISGAARLWIHHFLRLPYRDPQCGAKAFRFEAWQRLAPLVREKGWAFDMDVLCHARSQEMIVEEIPVRWTHVVEGSKVRAWKDVPQTLLATVRIWLRLRFAS